MTTLWSFLLVLSGLILVHETGHFLVARSLGIRVLKFSLGFGPRIWGLVRGGTDYCISAIPLGGFVKMLGEQPGETIPPEDIPYSFSHRPLWHRALVVAAGPLSNLVFAWLVFFVIFAGYGRPILLPDIGAVQQGSPAQMAGILPGDRIIALDGQPIKTWEQVSDLIKASGGRSLELTIERKGKKVLLKVTPRINRLKDIFGEEVETPAIGVTAAGHFEVERLNLLASFHEASSQAYNLIVLTLKGFLKLAQRAIPLSTLGGPIMIAQMAGEQAQQGFLNLFYFMALLSINLGLLNLLPIPVLDGGHLFLYFIEFVVGRPLSMRQKEIAQHVGIVILGALMIIVFYNDIMRLFGSIAPGAKP